MNSARVIKGQIGVYLTGYSRNIGPKELFEADDAVLLRALSFSDHDMSMAGWTRVGTASVEVTLGSANEIITSKVDALRALKAQKLADAQREATEIEQQIQTLLAITYDAEVQQ